MKSCSRCNPRQGIAGFPHKTSTGHSTGCTKVGDKLTSSIVCGYVDGLVARPTEMLSALRYPVACLFVDYTNTDLSISPM